MDVLTEIALFIGGIWLVRDLQLSWRTKSVVVVAYGLRLPVVLAAAVRLYYLHQSLYSDDASLHGILAAVCTQIELSYAVIATTMPCLKPFMSALNTQYGGGNTFMLSHTSPNSSALQRSRDTTGGGSSTFGTSSAKAKARAAAAAVMSGAGGGGNDGSKVRKSSESQAHMLMATLADDGKHSSGSNTDVSDGQLSRSASSTAASSPPQVPAEATAAPAQTPSSTPTPNAKSAAKVTKTTSITAFKSPFGGRSRTNLQPSNSVSVKVDISVSEEKESGPSSPTSTAYAQFGGGGGGRA